MYQLKPAEDKAVTVTIEFPNTVIHPHRDTKDLGTIAILFLLSEIGVI